MISKKSLLRGDIQHIKQQDIIDIAQQLVCLFLSYQLHVTMGILLKNRQCPVLEIKKKIILRVGHNTMKI